MKTLEQLLEAWENGTLTPHDIQEIKTLLSEPEARARLANELYFYGMLHDALKTQELEYAREAPAAVPEAEEKISIPPLISPRSEPARALPQQITLLWQWIFGVGVTALLVLCLHFLDRSRGALIHFSVASSGVMIERSGTRKPAKSGTSIFSRDVIKVPTGASATIQWNKEATFVELNENSEIQVLLDPGGKALYLRTGTLRVTAAKQPGPRRLSFVTPHGEARVIGTRFILSTGRAATRLEVIEGTVELQKFDSGKVQAVQVKQGQFATAGTNSDFATHRINRALLRETWSDASGDLATNVPSSSSFVRRDYVGDFQVYYARHPFITDWTKRYRAKICGYLIPPETGSYTFWMVSGNTSELWLSPDTDPAHKQKIAFTAPAVDPASLQPTWNWALELPDSFPKKTGPRNAGHEGDWHKFPSQKSDAKRLIAGKSYYIEVRYEVSEGDWVGALWSKPRDNQQIPDDVIRSKFLAPFLE